MPNGRETWTWRPAFIFAALGWAIGLGNIWRFPYMCYEWGGGNFVLVYIIALLTVGIPLAVGEVALGHRFLGAAPKAFAAVSRRFQWLGWMMVLLIWTMMTYYASIAAWTLRYVWESFTLGWGADPESFLWGSVVQASSGPGALGGISWGIVIPWAILWAIIIWVLYGGVKRFGRAAQVMMVAFFTILVVVVIRGVTLPGAAEGLSYYLRPDFSNILNAQMWLAAYGQVFWSVGVGFSALIVYGSYLKKGSDITNNATIVALGDTFAAYFAGFAVFSTLGYMALATGQPVTEVVTSGIGLCFVAYPIIFNMMPAGQFWAVIFFVLLALAALTSMIGAMEGISMAIKDKWGIAKQKAVLIACGSAAFVSLWYITAQGISWLDIVDHFVANLGVIIIVIIECVVLGYILGARKLRTFADAQSEWKIGPFFDFCIKYLVPVILLVLLALWFKGIIASPYGGYPAWALAIGAGYIIIVLPIVAYVMQRARGRKAE